MGTVVDFFTSGRSFELLRGSCFNLCRQIPDQSIDTIISDPPYGIDLKLNYTGQAKSIRGDKPAAARKIWTRIIPELHRIAKPDTAHVLFGAVDARYAALGRRRLIQAERELAESHYSDRRSSI